MGGRVGRGQELTPSHKSNKRIPGRGVGGGGGGGGGRLASRLGPAAGGAGAGGGKKEGEELTAEERGEVPEVGCVCGLGWDGRKLRSET